MKDVERIELLRGDTVVSSLAAAFGRGLRETRLTAMLGYLVALKPEEFCPLFGFGGRPRHVALETRHALDRSDILIETTTGTGIVEAKVGDHDPFEQAQKYPGQWRVLLTEHRPTASERCRGCLYLRWRDLLPVLGRLRWRDLLPVLGRLSKSQHAEARFVSRDLRRYLEEHRMIPKSNPVEIYAREINEERTLALFLHGQIYHCYHEPGSRLAEALYFAPHFGNRISSSHPGIQTGISYIARIERVEVIETFAEFAAAAREICGAHWLRKNDERCGPLRDSLQDGKRRSILFLGPPRLAFNPPIKKGNLQAGSGWLSKRFLTFDELFEAWT